MGKYPTKKGAVLLVEEEGSDINLARRLHSMARARALKDTDLANFYMLTRQFTKIPEDAKELFHLMAGLDIKLVVFDSLRRFHGCDENSSSEMQKVLDSFARLNIMTEASIVLIHHLAKGSRESDNRPIFERMRGSGDLWAWRDCILGVEGQEEAEESICSFQFRDAEAQDSIKIKRHIGAATGAIGLEAVSMEESEEFSDKSASILAFMKTQFGSMPKDAIFKGVKGGRNEFYRTFKVMAKQGLVIKNGSGWTVRND
jgi:RecA-family ATPase